MSVRRWFLAAWTVALVSGCASVSGGPQARQSWTGPLPALGLDGSPGSLAYPPAGRVRQVNHCGGVPGEAGAETVLADLEGPGCIVRLWAQDLRGTVRVYIDEAPQPVLATSLAAVFNGNLPPFQAPLAGVDGAAGYSYVPIPYRRNCRITVQDPGEALCFQATYLELPPETPLESFSFALTARDRAFFRDWRAEWNRGRAIRFVDRERERHHYTRRSLWPEENVQIWTMDGPATITELEMWLDAKDPAILDEVWLAVYWEDGDAPAVLAPLSLVFGGAALGGPDFGGPVLGKDGERLWCRLPMPFRRRATFRIVNHSESKIDFAYGLTWRPGDPGPARYLHARHQASTPEPGQPFVALHLTGPGHFAGCALDVRGAAASRPLDGRAILVVDDYRHGPHQAEAIGHHFNAPSAPAPGMVSGATHGYRAWQEGPATGLTAHRVHVTDPVSFEDSLALLFEHGPYNIAPSVSFAGVTYWYQDRPVP